AQGGVVAVEGRGRNATQARNSRIGASAGEAVITTPQYRARELADRCVALERLGHSPGDAERIAFEEALARFGSLAPEVYEAFVAPRRRRQHGVYFTPREVVDAQVRMAKEALA